MVLRIHNDHAKFLDVIRGRIKSHLKNFIKKGDIIAKKGDEKITVFINSIELPHFRFSKAAVGGIGQGSENLDSVKKRHENLKDAESIQASSIPGEHELEAHMTLEELADLLGEELGLPRIEHNKSGRLLCEKIVYTGIHTSGPNSLRHYKRSFKNALRRQIALGTYDKKNPIIIPIREDLRYRSFKRLKNPQSNAAILYMMDVSGSMGEDQKEIVRIESFWIDTWLKRHYDGVECRYIIHDAMAKEVDRDTFFHTRESGGTMISSAYKLCAEIIDKEYPSHLWNIYPFHFSDGDNWSVDDTRLCIGLLRKRILPFVNQFSYGQVESPYGSGQFIKDIRENIRSHDRLVLSEIKDREGIYRSIKEFLGRGR